MKEINSTITDFLKEAIQTTFSTTLSTCPSSIKNKPIFNANKTMITSIDFSGEILGSFSIFIAVDNAKEIVSKMLNTKIESDSSDIYDGIGELINITAGIIKSKLYETVYKKINIGIPFTITGKNLELEKTDDQQKVTEYFSLENFEFSTFFIYKMVDV